MNNIGEVPKPLLVSLYGIESVTNLFHTDLPHLLNASFSLQLEQTAQNTAVKNAIVTLTTPGPWPVVSSTSANGNSKF